MQSTDPRQSDSAAAVAGVLLSSCPEDDDTPTLAAPMVQPAFGGALAGRLVGNDLFVSYSGPSPCHARELGGLLYYPAAHLGKFPSVAAAAASVTWRVVSVDHGGSLQ